MYANILEAETIRNNSDGSATSLENQRREIGEYEDNDDFSWRNSRELWVEDCDDSRETDINRGAEKRRSNGERDQVPDSPNFVSHRWKDGKRRGAKPYMKNGP